MADSIVKKVKGLFMSKNKKKKADTDANKGFEVSNSSQAPDSDVFNDGFGDLVAPKDEQLTEAPMESDDISEKTEEIKPMPETKTEKAHEKVSRIAAEMNTKGYGL